MSVVYMWEKPVVKFIDFFTEFLRVQVRRILWLEGTELNFNVVCKTMIIVVYCFLFFDVYQSWGGISSFGIRIGSFLKLT